MGLLDWEEGTFRLLLATWRRLRGSQEETDASGAQLEAEVGRLAFCAQVLCAEPVRLREARGVGGLRGSDVLLPAALNLADDIELNREAYLVQTVIASGMRKLTRGRRPPPDGSLEGELASLRVAEAAVKTACAELPQFRSMYERVAASVLSGREEVDLRRLPRTEQALERARRAALAGAAGWDTEELAAVLKGARRGRHRSPDLPVWGRWMPGEVPAAAAGQPSREPEEAAAPTTELVAPAVDAVELVEFEESETNDPPPAPAFERAESLDSYHGPGRDLDGSDELNAHLDALDEVDLGALCRTGEGAQSLLRADLELGIDVASSEPTGRGSAAVFYDEWDERRAAYRKGWCAVYPATARVGAASWANERLREHRPLVRQLRLQLEAARAGYRAVPRELDGEEVDVDAATDSRISQLAGCNGDPRVYRRQRRRRRDYATCLLLDVSMSTDSWVDGRRTLDVSREAALVLGEAAHELGDRLQILAFASETRSHCHVWEVLGFGEAWATGKARLSALRPTGYTRIGPALRHASAGLLLEPAERRLLLLVSDAKPTDYDRYEGRYGIADVRRAVEEAERSQIRTHALAVDAVARDYLPTLFGRNGWTVLRRPEDLPGALGGVYGRLTAGN